LGRSSGGHEETGPERAVNFWGTRCSENSSEPDPRTKRTND
jgi:hypothetical protein